MKGSLSKIIQVAIFVPLAVYFWPTTLGGDTEFMIVEGKSMLPTIQPGSFVVTKTQDSYETGDIVSYDQRAQGLQRIVVHRIIEDTDRGFVIKGDNNKEADPGVVSQSRIRGEVVFATPYVGKMLESLRDPYTLLIVIGAAAVLQMGMNQRKKKKELREYIKRGYTRAQYEQAVQKKKKPRKPDYSLFYTAMTVNVLIFFALLYLIDTENYLPEGDVLTAPIFQMFLPSFASTVSFALYTFTILGLFLWSKSYDPSKSRRRHQLMLMYQMKKRSGVKDLLFGSEQNPRLMTSQLVWLGLLFVFGFHLLAMMGDLIPIIRDVVLPSLPI